MVEDDTKSHALQFNPAIADGCGETCPPHAAQPVKGKVYRGIRQAPMGPNDFLSHVELGLAGARPEVCEHWGLSVWVSEAAVKHAREVYRPLRRWHVASANLTPADGVILATPSATQPDHHTFWRPLNRDLTTAFTIVLAPAS
jgi:hypothetical protein